MSVKMVRVPMQQWQSRVWVSIGRELVMARTGEDVRAGKGRLFLFLLFFFSFPFLFLFLFLFGLHSLFIFSVLSCYFLVFCPFFFCFSLNFMITLILLHMI